MIYLDFINSINQSGGLQQQQLGKDGDLMAI